VVSAATASTAATEVEEVSSANPEPATGPSGGTSLNDLFTDSPETVEQQKIRLGAITTAAEANLRDEILVKFGPEFDKLADSRATPVGWESWVEPYISHYSGFAQDRHKSAIASAVHAMVTALDEPGVQAAASKLAGLKTVTPKESQQIMEGADLINAQALTAPAQSLRTVIDDELAARIERAEAKEKRLFSELKLPYEPTSAVATLQIVRTYFSRALDRGTYLSASQFLGAAKDLCRQSKRARQPKPPEPVAEESAQNPG
jgi:hypothetical protein